jgi:hypothetical protein
MLIPALYFYDVKYKPILSKKRHRSKSGEITNIEKYFFFNFFEMGRTLPKCMGWAEPSPTTWAGLSPAHLNSALHCSHAT